MINNLELDKYIPFVNSEFFNMGPMVSFIWVNDSTWSVEAVSNNLKDNFGYKAEDFISGKLVYTKLIHKDDLQRVIDEVRDACEKKQTSFVHEPYRFLDNNGEYKWVKDTTTILNNERKEITHFIRYVIDISDNERNPLKSVGTVQDITQLKTTELELKKTLLLLESYKVAMDESSIVSKTDLSGRITYVNKNFCLTSGYTVEELLGKKHSIVKHPNTKKELFEDLWNKITLKQVWNGILQNRGKNGDYWIDSIIVPILDENGNIKEYIGVRHDITKIIEHQKTIEKLATTDSLTSLGNRYKLTLEIQKSLNPAIALINIDSFSIYNDFYGHTIGDEILVSFANMIEQNNSDNFFSLYRLQGDEFALFSSNTTKDNFLHHLDELLQNMKITPIVLTNNEIIQLNITTVLSFEEAPILLQTVDMAYAIAKIQNKEFLIYSNDISLNDTYKQNILWSKKIKNAIREGRIVPYFQPIVNNNNKMFEKYETLVRLIDEDNKVISPYFFLEISKKTKQYTTITKIMIQKSFEHFKDKNCEFSVNLTMEDIINNEINEFIIELLEYYKIGSKVVFELVESESVQNFEIVSEFFEKLKSYGCKIAIDDFGSGYSNFEYILKLNVDYLKIDGSLIKNITTDSKSKIVVSTIVDFAKKLGIKTIGEFVENEEIFKAMQELGIDYSQGYYFQAPNSNTL